MSTILTHTIDRLPNTVAVKEGELIHTQESWIDTRWGSIIRKLHDKRPTWQFECIFLRATSAHAGDLRVKHGGEELGRIRYDYDRYLIRNFRSRAKLESGREPFAKTVDTLVKRVLKDFRPLSPREHYEQSVARNKDKINNALREKYAALNTVKFRIQDHMLEAIVNHWDECAGLRAELNISDDLRDIVAARKSAQKIAHHSHAVVEHVDGYSTEDSARPKSLDEFPEHMRTKISLLKVAPEGTLIPEVGVRYDNLFYIVKEGYYDG